MKNKSNFMFISMIILSILTLVVLILSCIHMFIYPDYDMSSWVMVVTLGIFTVLMIVCIVLEKFHIRKIGFYLLHIGLVMILIGCFAYFMNGQKYTIIRPCDPATYYPVTATNEAGEAIYLDNMYINIQDTEITYYPPTYTVYEVDTQTQDMNAIVSDLEIQDGYLDLGPYGGTNMSEAELDATLLTYQNPTNGSSYRYYYLTESTFVMENAVVSHYEATVRFDTDSVPLSLIMNHPVRYNGWKIYLMGIVPYNGADYVSFMFKKDPGEFVTVAGMIFLIVGTFLASFMRSGKPKAETIKVEVISAKKADAGKRKGAKR